MSDASGRAGLGMRIKDDRHSKTTVAWVIGVVTVAIIAFVAGRWTLTPPQADEVVRAPETYTVANATIGNTIEISATATWDVSPVGTNSAAGTVTGVDIDGPTEVSEGDALFAVNLRPVTVAQGEVPSFRRLSSGSVGADVAQLEAFLAHLGYFSDKPDGHFKYSTTVAVKAWQKHLGIAQTGTVEAGDLVYLVQLPATVLLDDTVQAGAVVAAGTDMVYSVGAVPVFTSTVSPGSRTEVPSVGTEVQVNGPGSVWPAVVADQHRDDTGNTVFELTGVSGEPVCGADCDAIPFSRDPIPFTAYAILAPEVSGPAVPLSALGSEPNGDVFLVEADGTRLSVTVRASDGSRAIVDGVDAGDDIRLHSVEVAQQNPTQPIPSAATSA